MGYELSERLSRPRDPCIQLALTQFAFIQLALIQLALVQIALIVTRAFWCRQVGFALRPGVICTEVSSDSDAHALEERRCSDTSKTEPRLVWIRTRCSGIVNTFHSFACSVPLRAVRTSLPQ